MAARKRQLFVLFQNYKRAGQTVFVGQAQVRGQGVGGGPFGGGAGQGKIWRATFFTQYRLLCQCKAAQAGACGL